MNFIHEQRGTILQLDRINLQYGPAVILRDVNTQVQEYHREECQQGRVIGLLGPSGMGKTQLLRIIAGLNKPTSGNIYLGLERKPVQTGDVGVVAQNYPLFEHRSVLGNLLIGARKKAKTEKEASDKSLSYLDRFGLTDRAKLYPSQISGGQRQRVAIIQQILCSDHFLVMDEPFSGLDLINLENVAKLVNEVTNISELNTTIVVTHDVTAACSVADVLWLLGRERDSDGNPIPGARIVETYDLVERELCWHPEILRETRFLEFVREVKDRFRTL